MTTSRIVIGALGGGDYGLKCSVPGVNARTADNSVPSNWSFHTGWGNTIRLAQAGFTALAFTPYAIQSAIVYHGLGFRPFVEARSMESTVNVVCDEFSGQQLVELPGGGAYVNAWQRVVAAADGANISLNVFPWAFKISGNWVYPNPSYCRVFYIIYRDPPS